MYSEVTHHGTLALGNYIQLATNGGIDTFINYGTITNTGNTRAFYWSDGYMRHLINHGTMGGIGGNRDSVGATTPMSVTNYGAMGAIDTGWGTADITINNLGSIGRASNDGKTRHLAGGSYSFIIKNYALVITQDATTFNAFSGNAVDNSQVVLDGGSMRFFDSSAKVILDFGGNFSFGEAYKLDKLFVDMSGKSVLGVDFSRLTVMSDIYYLTQNGDNFIVNFAPQYGIIGTLHKSNIRTMNNFYTLSNSMIYPHKYKIATKRMPKKKRVIRRVKKVSNLFNDLSLRDSILELHPILSLQNDSNATLSSLRELQSDSWQSTLDSPSLAEGARGWVDSIESLELNESFSYKNNSTDSIDSLESLESLASNESFAYKNDSNNLSDLSNSTTYINQNNTNHIRIANANERNQITNSTNYHRIATNQTTNHHRITTTNQSVKQSNRNTNQVKQSTQRIPSTNPNKSTQRIPNPSSTKSQSTPTTTNYHFILTPFLNHNYFFESGKYNLSGLEYGFLTAFSGKITPSNSLGTHFMMSYGSLKDNDTNTSKGDKEFNIKSLNLNVGLNYKLDLIFDSYLKARGDFYYFLNQVKTLTMFEAIKPNNLGFGASVAYGKDFDFGNGGVLGLEVGLDYKALQSNKVNINNNATKAISEIYQKNLYNLIYLDLGLNYSKYFNTNIGLWGINTTLGIKGNITANKLSKSQIHINNLNRVVNMVLDNDKILGYANISASYVLNAKDFDMEFSVAYYGNYGDRVISNGGEVEWRVGW